MDNDDQARGIVLTRREALALLGAAGAGLACGKNAPAAFASRLSHCVVRPEQTEGPYFVDGDLNRSDIRFDPSDKSVRPGAELRLALNVSKLDGDGCSPLPGVLVDLWQCDHQGRYSDVVDPRFDTTGRKYLRGYQATGEDGAARFTTIYPGWYPGRTVHIHFKIRSAPEVSPGFDFTSQLYFDDVLTDTVHSSEPYASRGARTRRNAGDGIFRGGGSDLLLNITEKDGIYSAAFDVALQLDR